MLVAKILGSFLFNLVAPSYNVYIPGMFYVNTTYASCLPPKGHIYITNQTRLSESCKTFFGEKSVYVHYTDKTKITDETTISVIDHISSAVIISKSFKKARYKYFSIFNIILNFVKVR